MRMFAGPNGSGKSELIKSLQKTDIPLGPVVNADIILFQLRSAGFIDLKEYKLADIDQKKWDFSIQNLNELSTRIKKAKGEPEVKIREDMLVCDATALNAYSAALIADFVRYTLVAQNISFSFETVMSHPGKIEFFKSAKEKGYKTYLYFVATDDTNININRVKSREKKGGHSVDEHKIITRYNRSLALLIDALRFADRAYILDNSGKSNFVLFEKKNNGRGYMKSEKLPSWFEKAVIEKLN